MQDEEEELRVNKMIGKQKKKKKKIKGKTGNIRIPCKNSRVKITSFKYKS